MRFADCVDFTGTSVSSYEGLKSYVSTGALDGDHIDFDQVEEVSYADKPSRANVAVQVGDVLFAKMMATKKTLRIDDDNKDFIYSTGFCAVRPKRNVLSSETLYRLLTSDFFLQKKDQKCTGATQKAATNTELGKIEINVPSIETQIELEGKFNHLDFLAAKRKEQLDKLELLPSALFSEMFGDPISNSKGWNVQMLGTAVQDVFAGGDKPQDYKEIPSEEYCYPIIANGNGDRGILGYSKNFRVASDAVTIGARGASIGNCRICKAFFTPVVRLITIIPGTNFDITFLYHAVKLLNYNINGAGQAQLTIPNVKSQNIILPPLPLQQEFAEKVADIEKQKELIRNSLQKLELLKNSLLQQYFA